MKYFPVLLLIILFLSVSNSPGQSGRRAKPAVPSSTPPAQKTTEPAPAPAMAGPLDVTAEKNEDYRCTSDGTLARIMEGSEEKAFLPKEVDTKAIIRTKPEPRYTRVARSQGVQGNVVLKVLLSASGDISRVRVVRALPLGLTETAIQAACEIKFTPALKDGVAVSQWVTVEYGFRLARSSIFGP